MENVQENIDIEGVRVPVIRREGTFYFPVSFVEKHLLLREKGSFLPGVKKGDRVKLTVDYSEWEGGIQEVNCVSEQVLAERLSKTRQRWLSIGQVKSQNKLHRYLGIQELDEEETEWDSFNLEWLENHDEYTKILITEALAICNPRARRCRDCQKVFPLMNGFFYKESGGKTLAHNCAVCKSNGKGNYIVQEVQESYSDYEKYLANMKLYNLLEEYRKGNVVEVYTNYVVKSINRFPDSMRMKSDLKEILMYLKNNGIITKSNLTPKLLRGELRVEFYKFENTTITEIYKWLYGDEFYLDKWEYPKFTFKEIPLTLELALTIFQRYLDKHNIVIDNPSKFNYDKVIRDCTLTGIYSNEVGGVCNFFVAYWKGKYAGYQFRNIGNYYSINEDNFLNDLRFLVEEDLKLKPEKIPLYVTRGLLTKSYKTIYNHLNRSGNSLFYYFDQLYPNMFDEADFTIGRYRNEFDSIEEQQVDGVIREYFSNVVYNSKGDNRVVLKGKEPDWFIMTEKGVWVVEYFGMYIENQRNNPIISNYIETTKDKIRLYDEMEGYKFVLVYPEDTDKGYLGLRDKLREIKDKYRVS